ncbi:MAG TPA: substrate-binding domain-containing protein [Thermoanaerobaculia bacterium]|jgi:ABC-type sugar transport system substrate-binding protein|nr:substrate-binding domain-containing protein [Thermoanaerobaculia bacterium]
MTRQKIIVSLLSRDQEFQVLQAADAERAAAMAGFDIDVVYANNNAILQQERLFHFVQAQERSRPVAIVAHSVAGDGLPRVAREAVKAGVGWVLLSRDVPYIDSLRERYPHLPIFIVSTDQMNIGRTQGRQFRSLLPAGGNVIYIQGPADTSAALQRLQGMEEAIAGAKINVKVLTGEWTEASGERALLSWLRLSSSEAETLDLVSAQNDAMAIGARKAIAARRPQSLHIPFTGVDGLLGGGQRLVSEGQLAATVIVPSNTGPAVDLVAAQLRTGQPAPARVVLSSRGYPS